MNRVKCYGDEKDNDEDNDGDDNDDYNDDGEDYDGRNQYKR